MHLLTILMSVSHQTEIVKLLMKFLRESDVYNKIC